MTLSGPGNIAFDVRGYTLVVPSLGLGNICQLATDLLINTLLIADRNSTSADRRAPIIERIGHIATSSVLPVVGVQPYSVPIAAASSVDAGTSDVSLNLELFAIPAARVVLLQQRAGAKDQHHELFVHDVYLWAVSAGIAKVLLLSGTDACLRPERIAAGERLVYISTEVTAGSKASEEAVEAAGVPIFKAVGDSAEDRAALADSELRHGNAEPQSFYNSTGGAEAAAPAGSSAVPPAGWVPVSEAAISSTRILFAGMWGTGYAPVYFRRFFQSEIPLVGLFYYASEGDNLVDAVNLGKAAARVLQLDSLIGGVPATLLRDANDESMTRKQKRRLLPAAEGLVLPPYFDKLYGPPVDATAGSYGY